MFERALTAERRLDLIVSCLGDRQSAELSRGETESISIRKDSSGYCIYYRFESTRPIIFTCDVGIREGRVEFGIDGQVSNIKIDMPDNMRYGGLDRQYTEKLLHYSNEAKLFVDSFLQATRGKS